MSLSVTAVLNDGTETIKVFTDPVRAAREVVAGIRSGVLFRVAEYQGTADECEAYADETYRLTLGTTDTAWSM